MQDIVRSGSATLPTRRWLPNLKGCGKWMAILGAGLGLGYYFGGGTLTAAWLGSFVVGLLPCVIMCGLGLCASRILGKRPATPSAAAQPQDSCCVNSSPDPVKPLAADRSALPSHEA
jgi:hypothetical protein